MWTVTTITGTSMDAIQQLSIQYVDQRISSSHKHADDCTTFCSPTVHLLHRSSCHSDCTQNVLQGLLYCQPGRCEFIKDLIYWDREINHFIFGDWTQMTHHGRQNRILVLIGVRTESTSEWLRSGGGVESERENDRRVQSFKAHRVDDDWLNEGSENMIELE